MDFAENSTIMADMVISLVFHIVFENPCEAHFEPNGHQGAISQPPENPFGRENTMLF